MATDGISRLIAVTQLKSENANDEALAGADDQRSIIGEQKSIRAVQSAFGTSSEDSFSVGADTVTATKPGWDTGAIFSEASVSTPAAYLDRFSRLGFGAASPFSSAGLAKSLDVVGSSLTRYAGGLNAFVEALKRRFEESRKDLEGQDKMSNFEINTLMSDYNDAATLASSVKKKTDDANASVISKLG